MKPSDIWIAPPTPLTGVFEHSEAEQMAGLIILTLAASDDEWRPVSPTEIGVFLSEHKGDLEWMNNPFFYPDVDDLVKRSYAEWVDDGREGRKRPVRFTPKGMRKLRRCRWNKVRRNFMDSGELAKLYRKACRRWSVRSSRYEGDRQEYGDRFCARALTLIPRWRKFNDRNELGYTVEKCRHCGCEWTCPDCEEACPPKMVGDDVVNSVSTCSRCGYHGPAPTAHECKNPEP